jgi:hypothetical protein
LSLDLAALPLTRFLTKFTFDFRMQLGAKQKSCVRLVRLLRKLSNQNTLDSTKTLVGIPLLRLEDVKL